MTISAGHNPLLLAHCIALVDASIADIKKQMSELVTEAQNDSKSTAGDKHETARAMMQLAQEQLGKQLQEAELNVTPSHASMHMPPTRRLRKEASLQPPTIHSSLQLPSAKYTSKEKMCL